MSKDYGNTSDWGKSKAHQRYADGGQIPESPTLPPASAMERLSGNPVPSQEKMPSGPSDQHKQNSAEDRAALGAIAAGKRRGGKA